MPPRGQISVSINTWVWEKVVQYFETHKQILRDKGIKSPSALIKYWCQMNIQEPFSI